MTTDAERERFEKLAHEVGPLEGTAQGFFMGRLVMSVANGEQIDAAKLIEIAGSSRRMSQLVPQVEPPMVNNDGSIRFD